MKTAHTLSREEWNALRYPIQIEQVPEDEGGDYFAWIPALGRGLFMADGETAGEALDNLETLRRDRYDLVIESGRPIPLPASEDDEEKRPAGKWLMRATPEIQAAISKEAEASNVSFNTYALLCLERGRVSLLNQDLLLNVMQNYVVDVRQDLAQFVRREIRSQIHSTLSSVSFDLSGLMLEKGKITVEESATKPRPAIGEKFRENVKKENACAKAPAPEQVPIAA